MMRFRRPVPPLSLLSPPGTACTCSRCVPPPGWEPYISGGNPFVTLKPLEPEFDPCGAPPVKISARRSR
jgi:hypothetical protein